MDLGLKGKVAVVTGASKGIGLGIAKELIKEGAKVAICARNAEETEAAAKLLGESGEVYYEVVDMSQEAQVYAFGQNVVNRFGQIDCWVNNVGAQLTKDGEEYTDELMERIYGVCFKSAAFGCQAAFRSMKDHGGSIVNISSLSARCPTTGKATLYGPMKAAVNNLTITMAGEYAAYGVRVNCVMPGYIMTEFNTENTPEDVLENICAGTLMQRTGRVEECAKPVVFMCGNGSTYMTGVTLEVSGGRFITLNPDYSFRERERLEAM